MVSVNLCLSGCSLQLGFVDVQQMTCGLRNDEFDRASHVFVGFLELIMSRDGY